MRKQIVGWWPLALAVGQELGKPVGSDRVRHLVCNSGRPIGKKVGHHVVFGMGDLKKVVALVRKADRRKADRAFSMPVRKSMNA